MAREDIIALEAVLCESDFGCVPDGAHTIENIYAAVQQRMECLNREIFADLAQAQAVIEAWREHYNSERPHSSLGYLPPAEFARRWRAEEATRCGGSGRATPSLRPHSAQEAATLSL